MLFRFAVYLLATAVAATLATIASTQFVLAGLADFGVALPAGTRLAMTLHDLGAMGPRYGALIAAGFVVALPVAGLLGRVGDRFAGSRSTALRGARFALAGATAMAAILLSMRALLALMPIAGARSTAGFAVQLACGAVGGWLYAHLTRSAFRAG